MKKILGRRTMKAMNTPYYLIDEHKLLANLKKIERLKNLSGAKVVLALKCFSTWCVFDLMRPYLDGTTSSSLYEARLGREKFGKEVHAYSVAFSGSELQEVKKYADKIIFNSFSQLNRFYSQVKTFNLGLRVNPGVSYSKFDLADPARSFSRLGAVSQADLIASLSRIKGLMFHFNCENDNFKNFSYNLSLIASRYKKILKNMEWVSLGGGIYFTKPGYPLNSLSKLLKDFSSAFGVQVYLEPGESVVSQSTELLTQVLDVVRNKINIAIVDASSEAHMLDLLIYRQSAKIKTGKNNSYRYMISGRSCLAGDTFGVFSFKNKLKMGSILRIQDAGGYTMVKKNWFNGLSMPSIAVKRLDGSIKVIRRFDYNDYLISLS